MSGKRLRIRARLKLSEHNLDWLAGQVVGHKQGIAQGAAHESRKQAQEKAKLLSEIVQLEQDLATARAAAALNARTVEDHRGRIMELEQEAVMLRQPAKSDWLSLPPFVVNVDPALGPDEFAMTTTGRSWRGNMVVRPRSHERTPQPHIDQIAALYGGGFINPEQSRRFIDQIINRPGLLRQARLVPMGVVPSMARGGRVPGNRNPTFRWNTDHAVEEPDAPIRLSENQASPLRTESEVMAEQVRAAFRMPMLVGSEMRTPEAEEGVRQASAEGVTNVAGGHSHSIDLDIRVDDSELRDAIARVEQLGEVVGSAGVSAQQIQNLLQRMASLETTMGIEPPEESAGEENVNVTGRSDPPGEE